MGGLIGRISFQGAADALPLGPLQHRGPDASGAWFSGDGRDRLGIKPLYLAWKADELLFASERRALPGGEQLDPQMISQVLAFGHTATPACFPGPNTPGVVSLPAGLVVRINHSRPHDPVRYWPPQPRPDWSPLPIRSGRWAPTFLRQQLEQVVEQHLLADVPVACFLSSGLDSGILTALASRLQPGPAASPVSPWPCPAPPRMKARMPGAWPSTAAASTTNW